MFKVGVYLTNTDTVWHSIGVEGIGWAKLLISRELFLVDLVHLLEGEQ
jgi:hypothetical protein